MTRAELLKAAASQLPNGLSRDAQIFMSRENWLDFCEARGISREDAIAELDENTRIAEQ